MDNFINERNCQDPNILVISNNCFSKTGSNGRTLESLFGSWNRDSLFQIYIKNEKPDFDFCKYYYCITDKEMLVSILTRKSGTIVNNYKENKDCVEFQQKSINKRTALTMNLRNIVWNLGVWKTNNFLEWIENKTIDVILFQAGDSPFMYKITRELANMLNVPIIFFNTEGYTFKKYNYLENKLNNGFLYKCFYKSLTRQFDMTINNSALAIYSCNALKDDYDKLYSIDSTVIMTASKQFNYSDNYKPNTFTYVGNLGVGRHLALIELAEALGKVNGKLKLDVYGKANDEIINEFNKCIFIDFHGFVSYEEVEKIYENTHFLIHVESFDSFYRKDLKYAFSTKIADLLSSRRCIISYSPQEYASAKYFKQYDAAFLIDNKENIISMLESILSNKEEQIVKINNAMNLSNQNHNSYRNKKKFRECISLNEKRLQRKF